MTISLRYILGMRRYDLKLLCLSPRLRILFDIDR
nr:MAG TPA: hypothetical protein [Caudoviricetes sp.]